MAYRDTSSLPRPSIERIERADLTIDSRTKQLYLQAVQRGYIPNNEIAVLEFFCWVEKALAEDETGTPGKLFYHLLKTKNSDYVTDEHEGRAMQRINSSERMRLVEAAQVSRDDRTISQFAEEESTNHLAGRDIGFLPSPMVQCFLPQKRLPSNVRRWEIHHGNTSLRVEAGSIGSPSERNLFEDRDVPFGFRPRLILPYIVGYAVQHKTPQIDMGRSLRKFCEKMGLSWSGRNGADITRAVEDIAASSIMLGFWGEHATRTIYSRVAKEVSFWIERNDPGYGLWQPEMVLSEDFFLGLQDYRVPIDMNHLMRLRRSPRRMDLYVWLSYRVRHIRPYYPVKIPYAALRSLFAPDIKHSRDFKTKLRQDLQVICSVHSFKIEMTTSHLLIHRSQPPIIPHIQKK